MGIVKNVKIGFNVALNNAKKIATIKAEKKLSTVAPGNK
jgi:hypothetical protein